MRQFGVKYILLWNLCAIISWNEFFRIHLWWETVIIITCTLCALARQQTQMKFYRASSADSVCAADVLVWALLPTELLTAVFLQPRVTAVVTCNNACQDFASVPLPKISPPHVSWISHDPKRPTLNFGPRLCCVHSFLLFLPVMEPRLPFPPSHPNPLCNIILPLFSLSSSIWKCS